MNASDAAKSIMKISGVRQQDLVDKFGKSGQSTISMILKAKSMRVDNLLMILDTCGYDLVARSRDGERPEYVIGEERPGEAVQEAESIKDMVSKAVSAELDRRGYLPHDGLAIAFADDNE